MYLQKEKAHLSLPRNVIRKPYQMTHTTVKVNSSCMITYRSNQYSVSPKYLGKRLVLQVYDNYLHVYYNTELIVIHPVSAKKLNYTQDHYVAISKQTFKDPAMDIEKIAKENLTQKALRRGSGQQAFSGGGYQTGYDGSYRSPFFLPEQPGYLLPIRAHCRQPD